MRRSLAVSLAAVAALVLAGGFGAAPTALAQETTVRAWVTLGSTSPAVGCLLPIAVEVHAGGDVLAGANVSVPLFVGDEVVGTAEGTTDGDGVAFLDLDTSGATAGAGGWLDFLVNGAFIGGTGLAPSEDGGCDDGGTLLDFEAALDLPEAQTGAANLPDAAPDVAIAVPTYVQQRNLSCEFAALYIATAAFGNGISEYESEAFVGLADNPHDGYRGDITGPWGVTDDYGVYAEPLSWVASSYGFGVDVFYAGGDSSQLTARLDAGLPTIVWMGLWGDTGFYEEAGSGTFKLVPGMHVMVAYGYDADSVYLSDPAIGGYRSYEWSTFMPMWNALDGMALAVSPA